MADSVVDSILLGELYLEVLRVTRGRKRARLERWFEAVAATVDGCTDDTPDGALIPQFVIVDLGTKILSTTAASGQKRSTPIESLRRDGGLIVLQGLENGRAFSFVIAEKSGAASVAIAREELILAVSAACTPVPGSQK